MSQTMERPRCNSFMGIVLTLVFALVGAALATLAFAFGMILNMGLASVAFTSIGMVFMLMEFALILSCRGACFRRYTVMILIASAVQIVLSVFWIGALVLPNALTGVIMAIISYAFFVALGGLIAQGITIFRR